MKVIDLFAGCGGLSLGFIKDNYIITKAVEFDENAAKTFKENHPNVEILIDDIKNIDNSNIFKCEEADVIIGGPPCQGFSMAGARIRNNFIDDPRNYLFKHYFNVVKEVKPKVFIMENVKGLLTMQNGMIFNEIQKSFSDTELLDGTQYYVHFKILNAVDFGVPQKRERLFIIGTTKKDLDLEKIWKETREQIISEMPSYFDKVTIWDAIGNLPKTTLSGSVCSPPPQSKYEEFLMSSIGVIENHKQSNHSNQAIERMKKIKNGENYTVLDEVIKSVHSGSYGRMDWNEQSSTITTRFDTPAGGRFIHPLENRTITPREAARIQSFPDDYVFYGDKRSISRQIGNAVPPKISYFLAKLVRGII